MALAHLIIFIGLNLYPLFVKDAKELIRRPTIEATQNLKEYFEKGIPLSVMLCFEWTALEALVLMSGALGVAEQATQTIFMNTLVLFSGMIFGIQTAVSSQVGRQIGRNDVTKAKSYFKVCKIVA